MSSCIQEIKQEDYEKALAFIKKSYLENIAMEDSLKGQTYFVSNFLYSENTHIALNNHSMQLFGFYIHQQLGGVISYDLNSYIQFLFVDKKFLKNKIGTQLLDYVILLAKKRNQKYVYLDSSLSSYPFYIKYGFIKKSDVCIINGMHFIPMVYEIK